MEINTFNEKFNELWLQSVANNHSNNELKLTINNLITDAKKKDSLVFLGDNHSYEPHKIIPISYDGENEYITMHSSKLLIYRDPNLPYIEGKVELSRSRVIVWPVTAVGWILSGTDSQMEFVKKYSDEIGVNVGQLLSK